MKKSLILVIALSVTSISVNAEDIRVVVSQESVIKTSAMSALAYSRKQVNVCLMTS